MNYEVRYLTKNVRGEKKNPCISGKLGKSLKRKCSVVMVNFIHHLKWVIDAQIKHHFWMLSLKVFLDETSI